MSNINEQVSELYKKIFELTWFKLILFPLSSVLLLPFVFDIIANLEFSEGIQALLFTIFLYLYITVPLLTVLYFLLKASHNKRFLISFLGIATAIALIINIFPPEHVLPQKQFKLSSKLDTFSNDFTSIEEYIAINDTFPTSMYDTLSSIIKTLRTDTKDTTISFDHFNMLKKTHALDSLELSEGKTVKEFNVANLALKKIKRDMGDDSVKKIKKKIVNINYTMLAFFLIFVLIGIVDLVLNRYFFFSIPKTHFILFITVILFITLSLNRKLEADMFIKLSPSTLFKVKNWNIISHQSKKPSFTNTEHSSLRKIGDALETLNGNTETINNNLKTLAQTIESLDSGVKKVNGKFDTIISKTESVNSQIKETKGTLNSIDSNTRKMSANTRNLSKLPDTSYLKREYLTQIGNKVDTVIMTNLTNSTDNP